MANMTRPVGVHLREWRRRRRMSQLELACEADISSRHLSFLETGRSRPSREMILHLAEQLEVPMRERNQSAFRGRGPAETDEQSSRHGPVSLSVVGASAYHYWEREAIDRPRRARDRPAKRGRSQ